MKEFLKEDLIKNAFKYKYIRKMDVKRKTILVLLKMEQYRIINLLGKERKKEKENKA